MSSSPPRKETDATHPVDPEHVLILVHTENLLSTPSDVELVLRRRVSDRSLPLEQLEQLLALGISEDRLNLVDGQDVMSTSKNTTLLLTCLIIAPISLSTVKILYASCRGGAHRTVSTSH